ncbi:hypothetical protein [Deinococcus radiophilus]|uniref:Uncharacterized protein n=1 Tax=Deinococcus radiophilus TaxID=32062 RepID=A0A431VL08_9DEIO|nr:hypothetical protein [Deinococcus radiophilus]RTR23124.1 hypothetical protein EJ104_12565 [Deinococcus radiophilus]UFA51962.1 hypothetical protein LMT64_13805 [Deinococcus radiophilus]
MRVILNLQNGQGQTLELSPEQIQTLGLNDLTPGETVTATIRREAGDERAVRLEQALEELMQEQAGLYRRLSDA